MITTVNTANSSADNTASGAANTPDEDIPSEETVAQLRVEIDQLDAEILRLVERRSEVAQQIGKARMASGGTRIVYNREMDVLARYRSLGMEGRELAKLLLRLGRGHLGREG